MAWSRRDDTTSPLRELLVEDDDPTAVTPAVPADPGPVGPVDEADPGADLDQPVEDSFLDDEDYLPQERRGPGRLTVALLAAVVLAVGVLGGVWAEKQLGTPTATASSRTGFPGAAGGMPGGAASGMPGGGAAGMPGGTASGAPGNSASGAAAAPSGGSAGSAAPVVVGTVASITSGHLVVTDLGGTKHTVTVSSTTTLTLPYSQTSLKTGDTVSITGTTTAGAVAATTVTVR